MSSPMDLPLHLFPHCVLFLLQNHLFSTLIDTGSDDSFIDISVVELLSLSIRSSSAIIGLASVSHQQPSLGTTLPLVVTPVIVTNQLTYGSPLKPHVFEILDLDENEYQFIIGIDLIPAIFPDGIPISIACRHSPSRVIRSGVAHTIVVPPPTVSTTTSSTPSSPIQSHQLPISSLEGQGYIPPEEKPIRVSTSTGEELEQEYNIQRNNILNMPHIIEAFKINEAITGFCNLPTAELKLNLDPELGKPSVLYSRQYPLSQRCIEAANPVIERWLNTGKIMVAPPGCPYNNPLTVAPKKDDQGNWTGFRVCLDVRKLNIATIIGDQFQIPLIHEVLVRHQGCSIFGEFDLAEAYLQFPLHPDCHPYTAFTWGNQQYMFVGCPFGLLTCHLIFNEFI